MRFGVRVRDASEGSRVVGVKGQLTVPRHADGEALLETAELAAIPVQSDHHAFAVPQTSVLDLLLNAAPKETLRGEAGRRGAAMRSGGTRE